MVRQRLLLSLAMHRVEHRHLPCALDGQRWLKHEHSRRCGGLGELLEDGARSLPYELAWSCAKTYESLKFPAICRLVNDVEDILQLLQGTAESIEVLG